VILGLLAGGFWWGQSTLDDLRSRVAARTDLLARLEAMARDYAGARSKAADIEAAIARHAGTDLSAFLEQAASRTGIRENLDAVREKSTTSEGDLEDKRYTVTLSRLQLPDLANFLYEAESAGYPLKVRTAKIRTLTQKDEKLLNLTLEVSAFRLIEEDAG
jgi:hypothetical protein